MASSVAESCGYIIDKNITLFYLLPCIKVNSICCLGEGSSFGEGVIFGSKRETMIVTTDHCQLLCVEADHIRSIYETHKSSMKSLVNFPGRPPSTGSIHSDVADGITNHEADVFTNPECALSVPVVSVYVIFTSINKLFVSFIVQCS